MPSPYCEFARPARVQEPVTRRVDRAAATRRGRASRRRARRPSPASRGRRSARPSRPRRGSAAASRRRRSRPRRRPAPRSGVQGPCCQGPTSELLAAGRPLSRGEVRRRCPRGRCRTSRRRAAPGPRSASSPRRSPSRASSRRRSSARASRSSRRVLGVSDRRLVERQLPSTAGALEPSAPEPRDPRRRRRAAIAVSSASRVGPVGGEREREGAAVVRPALVVLGRGHARADRDQARRAQGRARAAAVAPGRRSRTCRRGRPTPGSACRPLDGVVAVARPRCTNGYELAVGAEPPAAVLDDDEVALSRLPGRVRDSRSPLCGRLVVRHPHAAAPGSGPSPAGR